MQVGLYGLRFVTEKATFFLWSPWRATAIEHRIFEAIRQLPGATLQNEPDELRIDIEEEKTWKLAIKAVERVLKGWQEEASDSNGDRRAWYWLMESDTDANGYDHAGEAAQLWGYLRLLLEGPTEQNGDPGKGEWIDLEGFGFKIARATD
jgi:hypothetical protein